MPGVVCEAHWARLVLSLASRRAEWNVPCRTQDVDFAIARLKACPYHACEAEVHAALHVLPVLPVRMTRYQGEPLWAWPSHVTESNSNGGGSLGWDVPAALVEVRRTLLCCCAELDASASECDGHRNSLSSSPYILRRMRFVLGHPAAIAPATTSHRPSIHNCVCCVSCVQVPHASMHCACAHRCW